MIPKIIKADRIYGSNLFLRDIVESDARFVLDLRLDPTKSKYLSATSSKLEDQIEWIRGYNAEEDQAYFIVCNKDGDRLGCIRMYGAIGNSYCWGSWLMTSGLSPLVSIESALLIYAYGKHLGFEEARIDVRQDNQSAWKFHEKFSSAELISETNINRYYVVKGSNIDNILSKYSKLITSPLNIL